jgi:endonuclease/exonuclease/phosphatase family metal-dependent hydrolase
VCLHAVISVPDSQIGLVDVYSVHMPLSPTARNRTTVEVDRFIRASRLGAVQILLGDMNEEPHNSSMQFWSGKAELEVPGLPTDVAIKVEKPYTDAWLQVHPEPEPRSADARLRGEAFSFPSDDPKKRIDTAFITSMPPAESGLPDHRPNHSPSTIEVRDAWLVGQQPVPGSGNSSNPEHVGMVHPDSPLWASDHRGVVFDLVINRD